MGKILSTFGGIIAIIFGVILIVKWMPAIIIGLKICIVGALLFGGLLVALFGIIELNDASELKKMEEAEKQ